jgi:uncharacterized protein (DUF2249 family)
MGTKQNWHTHLADTAVPLDRDRELLDVRDLGPPDPLAQTLETLPDLPDETVLVQVNDRAPQHLYPKLDDRGYEYATVDAGDAVVTGIWRPAD